MGNAGKRNRSCGFINVHLNDNDIESKKVVFELKNVSPSRENMFCYSIWKVQYK